MEDTLILNKISQLPDQLKKEVFDFIEFLVSKTETKAIKKRPSKQFTDGGLTKISMTLSESALAEDWDNENDEYWASYLIKEKA
jgi:hypothetical protein